MLGLKVIARDAEKAKRKLLELNALDETKKVRREGSYVIFPIVGEREIKSPVPGCEVVALDFEPLAKRKKLDDYLRNFLTAEEVGNIRHSFDTIGDIAIIEVPDELEKHEVEIAEALLGAQKNVKSVFKKGGEVKDETRTRELKFLAGEERTETIYREHGCRYKLDVARVYFSPRLSHERYRVLEQTKDGETIVDMFAGIGPFSILLAKYRDVKVHAIDINPVAVEYLKENIRLNKVADKVKPVLGDCRVVAPRGIADRAIMNLPKSSSDFLDLALDIVKGGVIHFYAISPEDDLYDSMIALIQEVARAKNREFAVLAKRIVRPYAPRRYHVAIDILISGG